MKHIRKRLTYANVMSSIAVFLVIGGATAFAAVKLGKNTVGTKQLKKNAVTTVKIKNGAVTGAKIKNGAVGSSKIAAAGVSTNNLADGSVSTGKLADGSVSTGKLADGSVTGAKINAGSTPFSQIVTRIRGNTAVPFTAGQLMPLGNPTYTQPAGEDDQYIGAMDVTFGSGCTAPRSAVAFLLIDAANPSAPTVSDIAGEGVVEDRGTGTISRQMSFVPFAGGAGMAKLAPSSAAQHTFSIDMVSSSCSSGSGVTATDASVDVIGSK